MIQCFIFITKAIRRWSGPAEWSGEAIFIRVLYLNTAPRCEGEGEEDEEHRQERQRRPQDA